ncbi:MAG: hypothetical protein ACXQS2_02170 [Methermicoccaceae archaeon]
MSKFKKRGLERKGELKEKEREMRLIEENYLEENVEKELPEFEEIDESEENVGVAEA